MVIPVLSWRKQRSPNSTLRLQESPGIPKTPSNRLCKKSSRGNYILSDRSILLFHGSEAALASEHPAFKEHPFETDDLKRLPFGYVAIGHYHKPMDVARWSGGGACYSGSPEGLRFSEHNLGERSIVLGEMDERGSLIQLNRKPINARTMKTLSYSAGDGDYGGRLVSGD